jgi:hypothetical protein
VRPNVLVAVFTGASAAGASPLCSLSNARSLPFLGGSNWTWLEIYLERRLDAASQVRHGDITTHRTYSRPLIHAQAHITVSRFPLSSRRRLPLPSVRKLTTGGTVTVRFTARDVVPTPLVVLLNVIVAP